jgi:hypothetical protein
MEDHFRVHVIDPLPNSVELLNVEVDDLIIHPDVEYIFRFKVNRDDLDKIIRANTLQQTLECNVPIPAPEWWDVDLLDDVENYQYDHSDGKIITLCYHVSSQTAYYSYFTY